MRQTYSRDIVEELRAQLSAMQPTERTTGLSLREVVTLLKDEIMQLTERGYTLQQVAESLTGFGIKIKTPTLRSYITELTKQTQRKKHKPSTSRQKNLRKTDDGQPVSPGAKIRPDRERL